MTGKADVLSRRAQVRIRVLDVFTPPGFRAGDRTSHRMAVFCSAELMWEQQWPDHKPLGMKATAKTCSKLDGGSFDGGTPGGSRQEWCP